MKLTNFAWCCSYGTGWCMHHCKFPNTHMQAVTYVLRHTEEQENTLTQSWCPEQHRSICSRFCWALPPSLISDQCPLTMYSNETISVYCRGEEYGDIAQECACRLSANHPLGRLVCLNLTLRPGMRGPLSTITSSEKAITDKSVKSWMGYQSWNQWSREQRAQLLQWEPLGNSLCCH